MALRHRVDVLALTDHDTSEGIPEALTAAQDTPLKILPGIEMATVQADGRTIDLLGYFYDIEHAELQAQLAIMRSARRERAAAIVEKLAALGLPIRLERVLEIAGKGTVARPHIAEVMLEAGHVATRQQAFDQYIGNESPAYVPHYEINIERAIALLHAAGGVAVLAHPIRVRDYADYLPGWVDAELDGLEVYYPDHGPQFTMQARVLARRYNLIMTGGSDFHRMEDGVIKLGSQTVPPECVAQLEARAAQYR